MASNLQQIAERIAAEFIPLYDELTTSDLQGCVGAAVAMYHLGPVESFDAENLALALIYKAFAS